eukprot:gnl/MRDRNA2_/MRDRNA2_28068_c0_seq1.p1 gnl/MRDRNA2_/MRDRNA2_28068_c0~~gnl/MRDRNA2_/MRDRNA2_28068_c0_seq1.p1  ORF type:complete len:779 (+),score=127.24 gnl/MRDRNA2_/MRDRNA2_28068_c0_seq1:112-2448(+)
MDRTSWSLPSMNSVISEREIQGGSRFPPFTVTVVCLGVQFFYLCSYSVVIPQSSKLVKSILHDGASEVQQKLYSGTLIGLQNVAFGAAVYLARYKFVGKERLVITISIIASVLGSFVFYMGAAQWFAGSSLSVLLVARVIQGLGAGVDFTAKHVITVMSSHDMLSVYNSYWSMACSVGTGTGPLLVFLTSHIRGTSNISSDNEIGVRSADPLFVLCCLEATLLIIHFTTFPQSVARKRDSEGAKKEVIKLDRRDRAQKIWTSVFLGFVRHLVRTAWEAVASLALEDHFKLEHHHTSLLLAGFYFTSIPAQTCYKNQRHRLSDSNWMHAMCFLTIGGVLLLWMSLASHLGDMVGLIVFVIASLLVYDGMAIHATVSDVVGVKFADPDDPTYNSANVIFWQIMAKGCVGRSLGPVVGRLSVVGQWTGFALLSLFLLVVSELLTIFVIERQNSPSENGDIELQDTRPTAPLTANAADEPTSPAPPPKQEKGARHQELVRKSFLSINAVVCLTPASWEEFRKSPTLEFFAFIKHGDAARLKQAACEMVKIMQKNNPLTGYWLHEQPEKICIISPPYRKVPTAGVILAKLVQIELSKVVGKHVDFFQMMRRNITNGDFAAMHMAKRRTSLMNQFYLETEDEHKVSEMNCLVIDDAVMYGTHILETRKVLVQNGVDESQLAFITYLEANNELLLTNPTLEDELNKAFTPSVEALQHIMGQPDFLVTLRLLKLLLKLPEDIFSVLVEWLEKAQPEVLKSIIQAADAEALSDRERFNRGPEGGAPQ